MIVVPPPRPPSSSSATATVAGVLPLGDAPAALRGAPLGAIIQGTVASNAPGALVVQTAQGLLTLPVNLAGLKVGQTVTLTLQPGAGGAQILIQPERPRAPGSSTVSDVLPNLQGAAQPARPGLVVQAIVIRAAPAAPNGALGAGTGAGTAALADAPLLTVAASASPAGGGATPTAPSTAPSSTPAAIPATSSTLSPGPAQLPSASGVQTIPVANAAPNANAAQPAAQSQISTAPASSAAILTVQPSEGALTAAAPLPGVGAAAVVPTTAAQTSLATPPASPTPAARPDGAQSGLAPTQDAGDPSPSLARDAVTPSLLRSASNGERVALRVIATLPAGIPSNLGQAVAASSSVAPLATGSAANPAATTPNAAADALLAPGNFAVVVVGSGANGSAIVRAGGALLTLEGVSAPVNSALVLGPATARGTAPTPARLDNAALAATLPGVAELISAANAAGGPAQAAMQAILPRLGPHMAAGMAFFMRALKTGDLGDWLGKDVRTSIERSGRSSSVKKAAGDLERVARSNETSEWSAYPIPLGVGGQRVEPIRLYVRQAEEDGENASAKPGQVKPTRFLIDLNLSRLGRLQIDGLARLPKLDLVLRSESALNPALQQPLRRLFSDVTSARGIQGEMSFQVAPPIDPTVATPKPTRPGIMV